MAVFRSSRWFLPLVIAAALATGCSSGEPDANQAADVTNETQVDDADSTADGAETPATTDSTPAQPPPEEPGSVVLIDAGEEPLMQLAAAAGQQLQISVVAVERVITTSSSLDQDSTYTANYDLGLVTRSHPSGFELVADRTVHSLVAETAAPELSEIAGYAQAYGTNGVPALGRSAQELQYSHATQGLLVTPNLVLVVPDEPVGQGAEWTIPLDRSGELAAQVSVEAITNDHVEIAFTFTNSNEQGSFTMIAQGTYDRNSLLALDVTTESIVRIATQVSDNGQLIDVDSEQRSTRTYEGASS